MTNNITTIIVEDQPLSLKGLALSLKNNCPHLDIVAQCSSGEEAIIAIHEHRPQLLFLDYDLITMTAFDVLDRLQSLDFKVIFTTQFDGKAIEAINKYNPIYYLVKPIEEAKLIEAVRKATSAITESNNASTELAILQELEKTTSEIIEQLRPSKFLIVPSRGERRLIPYNKILYLEADSDSTKIVLASGQLLSISKVLKEVTSLLPTDKFCRVHRSFTVNAEFIESIEYKDSIDRHIIVLPHPKMEKGARITVGPDYKDAFFEFINP